MPRSKRANRKSGKVSSSTSSKTSPTVRGNWKCDVCGHGFTQRSHLRDHCMIHTGERPHECGHCGAKFRQKCVLKRHQLRSCNSDSYKCKACGIQFEGVMMYQNHSCVLKAGNQSVKDPTKVPNMVVNLPTDFSKLEAGSVLGDGLVLKEYHGDASEEAVVSSTNSNEADQNVCPICNQVFSLPAQLGVHMRRHAPKSHRCEICSKGFKQAVHLREHALTHTGEKPYACDICGLQFRQKGGRNRHVLTQHHSKLNGKGNGFVCNECGLVFKVGKQLLKHRKEHKLRDTPRSFQCDACPMKFSLPSDLVIHKQMHEMKNPADDIPTGSNIVTTDTMAKRMTTQPRESAMPDMPSSSKDDDDDDKSKNYTDYKSYVEAVSDMNNFDGDEESDIIVVPIEEDCVAPQIYDCEVCGYSFLKREQLRNHKKIHSPRRHVCPICSKAFKQRVHLAEHIRRHTGEKPFACFACDKQFVVRGQLNRHIRIEHGGLPMSDKFPCPICSQHFNTYLGFYNHCKTHPELSNDDPGTVQSIDHDKARVAQPVDDDAQQAATVSSTSTSKVLSSDGNQSFQTYILVPSSTGQGEVLVPSQLPANLLPQLGLAELCPKPSVTKPFKCQICDKMFPTAYTAVAHMRTHAVKKHQCTECGKGFRQRSHLREHMLIHNGVYPFECLKCDKKFRQRNGLNKHILQQHGHMPYPCKHCDKEFRQSAALKIHQVTDHQLMTCAICKDTYVSKSEYDSHMFRNHGISNNGHECRKCGAVFQCASVLAVHQKSHSNETYACPTPMCIKTFNNRSALYYHIRTHAKRSKCRLCSKRVACLKTHTLQVHRKSVKGNVANVELHKVP